MPSGRKRNYASSYTRKIKRRRRTRGMTRNAFKRKKSMRRSRAVKTFPKTQLVELTYCDEIGIPELSAGAPYKFRLNSIFDPDVTSTGHQPRGHDQWNAIYNKYCVIGARVIVEPLFSENYSNGSCTLFGYVDDDSASDNYTIAELRELNMPGTTHKYVQLGTDSRGVHNAKRSPNLTFNVGMKKFFGISAKEQIIAPRAIGQGDSALHSTLTAPFGFNPVATCYLKLHADNTGRSTPQVLKCRVTIKYMVVCHDPKEIGSS